jgi:HSP20 family molecular chaperone IbpA
MTRLQVFASPHLLGFEALEEMLERAARTAHDGYPPYNIERFPSDADGMEDYRLSLAVAGFSRQNLEIMLEGRHLTVRGRQTDGNAREFLHRGIAARQFAKSFLLASGMEVMAAKLGNGLLVIHLQQSPPDRVQRRIEIGE